MFEPNEVAILNENCIGLKDKIGERCVVKGKRNFTPMYKYDAEFDDGSVLPVKDVELKKLTDIDKHWMNFIFTGNEVYYYPVKEVVTIVKCDYLNRVAEVKFDDGSQIVMEFDNLEELDSEKDLCKYPWGNEEPDEFLNIDTRHIRYRNVIEEIHRVFKVKNSDYGNSFGEQYNEYGILSAVIRLDDKMRRLKQLMKQDAQVKDESIRDTLLDMANYSIMTVMELDNK